MRALDPQPHDHVIEIGPGKGTLTQRLAPFVESVVAIERDATLAAALDHKGIERCRVVSADALEVDWYAAWSPPAARSSYKVAANIPYAITTPLRRFVAALFGERRKQLIRALRIVTGFDPEKLRGFLDQVDLDPRARPEVLTPQEFVNLFRVVRR